MALRSRSMNPIRMVLDDYSATAIVSGVPPKREWVVPAGARILGVLCYGATAGTGTATLIDVNMNGTTVYTTQSKRPSLLPPATGLFTDGMPDVGIVSEIVAGSGVGIIGYDVDDDGTTGPARFSISIILGMP